MIVDLAALVKNADAWRAFTGNRLLYAVVKADAYGIGTARAVRALEDHVDAWCVTGLEEAREVRAASAKRIICIAALVDEHVAEAVDLGVEVSLASPHDLQVLERAAARSGLRVRAQLAVRSVAGWVGVAPRDAEALARAIAASEAVAAVEAWTHLSGEAEARGQLAGFQAALQGVRAAGIELHGQHVASTAPALWLGGEPPGNAVRIGIGLFGSAFGAGTRRGPDLAQALAVHAVVERVESVDAGIGVGYGAKYTTRRGDRLATARFGYANGMPRRFAAGAPTVAASAGELTVVAMGMQFLTCVGNGRAAQTVEILGPRRPLDEVAAAAGVLPHELVLSLAHAARASGTLVDSDSRGGYTTCGDSR